MGEFTYVELFAGIKGFGKALDKLGGECLFTSEIDKYAQQAIKAMYPNENLHGDITKIANEDIPNHDLLVGGMPCFPAGQKIITSNGFKNIEGITSEDYVLTHKGRYRKVVTPMSKIYSGNLYKIRAKYYGVDVLTTEEHPFYTQRGWVEAKNLKLTDYVAMPRNYESQLPNQFDYEKKSNLYHSKIVTSDLPFEKEDFWRMIGYWLAEGWTTDKRKRYGKIRHSYRIVMATTDKKSEFILPILKRLNIRHSITSERTCEKIHITNQELWLFIKQFNKGTTASAKLLPEFTQNLPHELASALIEGYWMGDGCTTNGNKQVSSTSLALLEGIQRLLLKTENRLYSLGQSHYEGTKEIEGRTVNTKDAYTLRAGSKQGNGVIFEEDFVYYSVRNIEIQPVQNLPVFNCEVEEDNSYCLPMMTVHNCQAFSLAGKGLGFEDTRGTLFFEIARIAKYHQPKAILIENVKGLVSHDKGRTLDVMIHALNNIGYTIDFTILNSKFFNVPQSRERIFIVALRNDLITPEKWIIEGNNIVAKGKRRLLEQDVRSFNFDWPEQKEVTTRLKDILEKVVDERYYLSDEKTASLLKQLAEKDNKSAEKGESIILDVSQMRREGEIRVYTDIAPTLAARDYKEPRRVLEPQNNKDNDNDNPQIKKVGNVHPSGNGMNGVVYDIEADLAPTLTTNKGEGIKFLHLADSNEIEDVRSCSTRTRAYAGKPEGLEIRKDDVSNTITSVAKDAYVFEMPKYRIRKLTPLETWRLQSFSDEDFFTVKNAGVSDTQLYKQSGNAVTVKTVEAIGKKLLKYL